MPLLAAIRGELFKLQRRPAVWVTIGLFLVLAVAIGYGIGYAVATHLPTSTSAQRSSMVALRSSLYPATFVQYTLNQWRSLGGVFALILGVLAQGSEYGWATVKTMYLQLPGRVTMLVGKLAALTLLVLVFVVGLFVVDAVASYVVATLDGKRGTFPAALDIARGLGAGWLIFGFWAMLGFGLATLFRQSAMAIGLGLAYGLILEFLLFAMLGRLGDTITQIETWFPVANTGYLAASFGQGAGGLGGPASAPAAGPGHAVLVLVMYVVAFAALSAALVQRRDVT
jgi:ABC-2 type transport system permease protein